MTTEQRPSNFSRYPMLIVAVCFSAGILVAKFAAIDMRVSVVTCVVATVGALAFRERSIATGLIAVAFAAAGILAAYSEQASVRPDRIKVLYDSGVIPSYSPVEVEGILTGRPEPSFDGEFLTLRTQQLWYRGEERTASGSLRIFVPSVQDDSEEPVDAKGAGSDAEVGVVSEISNLRSEILASQNRECCGKARQPSDLKYGSRVRVACRLIREDEYLDPGVARRPEMLDRLGVDAGCTVKSPLLIEHTSDESVFVPLAWVYDERGRLIEAFRANLDTPAAGVMIASLLGDKYFLDKQAADAFREGGTFHILVISGLHITFIGGLLLLLIRRLTRNRWIQFVVTSGVLWAYTLAVGGDVPVVRASVMFTVVLFSYAIYRTGTLLNSLGVCALILLVWRPSDLFNPSFQLTFVSVAAIVSCAYPVIETLRAIGTWTPTAARPFPPNVPKWLRRFCETIYWNKDAWKIESKRQIWTARLFKSPYRGERGIGTMRAAIRYVFEAALVSLIVQIWMLPIVVVYFHRVSFSGVVLNIWVGVSIAVESFAAVIGGVLTNISSFIAQPFFAFADACNWLMLLLPRLLTDNGWASFRLPAYSHGGRIIYFLYFLPLLFLAIALTRWKPFSLGKRSWLISKRSTVTAGTTVLILITIVVFHPFSAPRPDGRLHVDFMDVGQGDSALITFPDGETLLVDGGGRPDYRKDGEDEVEFEADRRSVGEAVVSEVLWDQGLARIDHILATHADADHIDGLNDVAKNFGVGSAIFGRTPANNDNFVRLANTLSRRGIPTEIVARGDRFRFGDTTLEVLYPTATDDANAPSDNNHSVVLRLVYGSRAFLLTGDIEQSAEQTLLDGGGTLQADVIKVPHHGSRTSSTQALVDAVRPKYAVISVGRRSPFGHPSPDVIERWRANHAEVMTTGAKGMISVSTDGRDLEVATFTE